MHRGKIAQFTLVSMTTCYDMISEVLSGTTGSVVETCNVLKRPHLVENSVLSENGDIFFLEEHTVLHGDECSVLPSVMALGWKRRVGWCWSQMSGYFTQYLSLVPACYDWNTARKERQS